MQISSMGSTKGGIIYNGDKRREAVEWWCCFCAKICFARIASDSVLTAYCLSAVFICVVQTGVDAAVVEQAIGCRGTIIGRRPAHHPRPTRSSRLYSSFFFFFFHRTVVLFSSPIVLVYLYLRSQLEFRSMKALFSCTVYVGNKE